MSDIDVRKNMFSCVPEGSVHRLEFTYRRSICGVEARGGPAVDYRLDLDRDEPVPVPGTESERMNRCYRNPHGVMTRSQTVALHKYLGEVIKQFDIDKDEVLIGGEGGSHKHSDSYKTRVAMDFPEAYIIPAREGKPPADIKQK